MDANGQLQAKLDRRYFGQSGTTLRAIQKMRGPAGKIILS